MILFIINDVCDTKLVIVSHIVITVLIISFTLYTCTYYFCLSVILCTGAVLFSISSRTTMEISIYTFCVILRNIYILYCVFLCFYCEINQYNTKYSI